MKKKFKIALFIILYIIAYLYLCILCNIGDPTSVSQTPLRWLVFLLDSPITLLAMSWSLYLWIIIAFFLTLFIVWEMDLEGPKLNRAVFIGIGITLLLTFASFIITAQSSDVWATVLGIVIGVGLCFGGGFLLFYLMMKKQGRLDELNNYNSYKDIMTEEEFNKWQERKHKND
ncbi:MAG: hypothetical protein LUG46_08640 [Erysipelotrichaceae bacterium]|nr:hypothetical protein [Erysipelotrichaceae bacterium]